MEFLVEIVVTILFEVLVKGSGYIVLRVVFRQEKVDPDGLEVLLAGLGCWVAMVSGIWGLVWLLR